MGALSHALTTLPGSSLLWIQIVVLVVGVAWLVVRRLSRDGQGDLVPFLLQLGVHLAPVVLLSAVFLLVGGRLRSVDLGGTDLSAVILAAAVTTPWLSQAFTAPFYREWDAYDRTSRSSVAQHVLSRWPQAALAAVPASVVVAAAETALLGWSVTTGVHLAALLLLNVWFAQSLTGAYMGRASLQLLSAWVAYAIALLLLPTVWWLPPVAAMLTQIGITVHQLGGARPRPRRVPGYTRAALEGALTASAMWALPLALYLRDPAAFPAALVFSSLVPAALVYQAFFAQVAGRLDRELERFRHELAHRPAGPLRLRENELYAYVRRSARTLGIGGVLVALAALDVVSIVAPGSAVLFGLLCVVGLLAGFSALLAYQLGLLERRRLSRAAAALVLLATVTAALVVGSGTALVVVVLAASLVATLLVALAARSGWRSGAYTLFWSRALGA